MGQKLPGTWAGTPEKSGAAEGYRRKAERMREMARATTFDDVRDGLLDVARQYEMLADHAADTASPASRSFRRREPEPR
jgi:hypothetical protein